MLLRLCSLALLLLALAACATAKESYLKDGYRLLSGEETRALHQDKTHEVKLASGKTATNFFTADGRSSFVRSDRIRDQGNWSIRGHLVCYLYSNTAETEPNCFSVAEKDGRYVLFKEILGKKGDFGAKVTSITPGNTENLPLK